MWQYKLTKLSKLVFEKKNWIDLFCVLDLGVLSI